MKGPLTSSMGVAGQGASPGMCLGLEMVTEKH